MTKAFLLTLYIFLGVLAYVLILSVNWTPLSSGFYRTVAALACFVALVAEFGHLRSLLYDLGRLSACFFKCSA